MVVPVKERLVDEEPAMTMTEGAADRASILIVDDRPDKLLVYRTLLNPRDVSFPLVLALAHFFNHQTHHRGQATTLLMQLGVDPGITDLIALPGLEQAA